MQSVLALLVLVALACAGTPAPATAQPDSVRAEILEARGLPPTHTPRKALVRGAMAPGWGQVYNRQYYKLPFVYVGLAGLGYAIYRNSSRYRLYQRAHLYKIEEEETPDEPNPFAEYEAQYNTVVADVGGDIQARQLRSQRDRFRRWRDLSIVGTGVFYALTLVDAYVSAHLLTFNVSDDLAVRIRPHGPLLPPGMASLGAASGTGLHVSVRF